ncbi:hypothetical protein BS47DRAFT_1348137, partial [Hydnum rufescens UP504]
MKEDCRYVEIWIASASNHSGVYFPREDIPVTLRGMSGGRVIYVTDSTKSHCTVSLFDLNGSRGVCPRGEQRMERPDPVHVASRSISSGEYRLERFICDDEHIIIWAVCSHIYICVAFLDAGLLLLTR